MALIVLWLLVVLPFQFWVHKVELLLWFHRQE